MSTEPQYPGKLGVPEASSAPEKTRIEIFLPSSTESHPDSQDSDSSLDVTEESEGIKWEIRGKSDVGRSSMAHPLYQSARTTDEDKPRLTTRFAKFSSPGTEAVSLSSPGRSDRSTGLLGDVAGLPGPGIGKKADFLSSYSHNYGQSEGGKTWWSAK